VAISAWGIAWSFVKEPSIDRVAVKPPVPPYLLSRQGTFLGEFVQSGFRDFQILGKVVDR
jgi:hypothetical protein